jgi:SAM-dependent methyltransferase
VTARGETPSRPYPTDHRDRTARERDDPVRDRTFPHQFLSYEADPRIVRALGGHARALELGAGAASGTPVDRRHVRRLVAADLAPGMLGLARRRLARGPRVEMACADAVGPPFRNASFDAGVGRGVVLGSAGDPRRVLCESRRALRPGGALALDAMADAQGDAGCITRPYGALRPFGGEPVYRKHFPRGDRQVRQVHALDLRSPLARRADRGEIGRVRPPGLPARAAGAEESRARRFRSDRLRPTVPEAGFRDVRVRPRGLLFHAADGGGDPTLSCFVSDQRRTLSRLFDRLNRHLRFDGALHPRLVGVRAP